MSRAQRVIIAAVIVGIAGCSSTPKDVPPEVNATAERAYLTAQSMVRERAGGAGVRFPAFGPARQFSRGNDHTSIECDSVKVVIQPSKDGTNLLTLDGYVQAGGPPKAFTARLAQRGDSIAPWTGDLGEDVDLPE